VSVVSVSFTGGDDDSDAPVVSMGTRVAEIISKWVDVIPQTLPITINRNYDPSSSCHIPPMGIPPMGSQRVIIDPEITVSGEKYHLCSMILADESGYSTAFKSADRWFLFDSRIPNDQVRSISFKQLSSVSQRHCCFCVYDHTSSLSSAPDPALSSSVVGTSAAHEESARDAYKLRDECKRLIDVVSRPCVIVPCEFDDASCCRVVCSLPMYRAAEEVPMSVTDRIKMLIPTIKTVKLDEMMGFSWHDFVEREFDALNDLDPDYEEEERQRDRDRDGDRDGDKELENLQDGSSMPIEPEKTDRSPSIEASGSDDPLVGFHDGFHDGRVGDDGDFDFKHEMTPSASHVYGDEGDFDTLHHPLDPFNDPFFSMGSHSPDIRTPQCDDEGSAWFADDGDANQNGNARINGEDNDDLDGDDGPYKA
jgi:hypothetical protein